jgi:hypothetical protein
MTEMNGQEREMDPRLLRKLEVLRPTPERDAHAAEMGRQRFLNEIDSIPEYKTRSPFPWGIGWFISRKNHKEKSPVNPRTKRFAFTTAAAIITILVLLFGGVGATAFAAQSALPGDALYSVKTSLEQTRVILARDAYDQAQLHLAFAQRRLDEMAELVRQGRYSDVEMASSEFEAYIQRAISALETVMAGDTERGLLLSNQITNKLLSYALVLKEVLAGVPDAIRPAVERALHVSQTSAGEENEIVGVVESIADTAWIVSGQTINIIPATEIKGSISVGDQVKVHAVLGSDGSLTAREIELFDGDIGGDDNDNGDDNANDNDDNGNDNADDNANDNDDNGNDNADDNANDNDDNGNDNGDDNANDNDDNGNDNGDDNANDNDDNGNDNADDNANDNDDNANDNGDDNGNDNDNANDNGNDNDGSGGDDNDND